MSDPTKIYLFEIEDENGIGLMALDEHGGLELEKTYAAGNKMTTEWVEDMKLHVGLTSDHSPAQIIYVKEPDLHVIVTKLYEAWVAGDLIQSEPEISLEENPEAIDALRAKCHLCATCLMQPLCSVAQSIAASEHFTLAVLSHCNAYTKEPTL